MPRTIRNETFPAPKALFAQLRNRSGDITVTQGGDDVVVTLRGDADLLDQIEVRLDEGTLTVDASHLTGPTPEGLVNALLQAITSSHAVEIQLEVPAGSRLQVKGGSGEVRVAVSLAGAGLDVGSGDVRLGEVTGEVEVRTGSGDVTLAAVAGAVRVSSGSGDLHLERAGGPVDVKTGAGDIVVGEVRGEVRVLTGSGDLRVERMGAGRLGVRTGAGDVSVGVEAGLPVWTDISTLTGEVRSTLRGAGQAAEGDPFVELRAVTVAGDIRLFEVDGRSAT